MMMHSRDYIVNDGDVEPSTKNQIYYCIISCMENCVFCKIARGEIPKDFDYEDNNVMAFADINPVRPVHILLVPKKHFEDLYSLNDSNVLFSMLTGVKKIVDDKKLMGQGFRVVTNGGGAQIIDHLHFHLIGPVGSHEKI